MVDQPQTRFVIYWTERGISSKRNWLEFNTLEEANQKLEEYGRQCGTAITFTLAKVIGSQTGIAP